MQYPTSLLAFAATISAHGFFTSPQARLAGDAMKAACGQQVYNNQASDNYGNIQGELQVAASQIDYNAAECNIWLCKGFKFADNTGSVQSWTAGQVVDFTFDVRAPHTGYANVSIVNTATDSIIGDMLLVYSDFADNSKTIPANETSFSLTIPSDLGDICSTAAACVLQHYWNAASIDQTYESCIDFTVGGSGSGSVSSSSVAVVASSTSASVVVGTSAPVVSSTAAAVVTSSSESAASTTLQTVVKSSSVITVSTPASVSTVAPAQTSAAYDEDDDECE